MLDIFQDNQHEALHRDGHHKWYRLITNDLGSNHSEAVIQPYETWSEPPSEDEPAYRGVRGEGDLEANRIRAARRAKRSIRFACKTAEFDRMVTLTTKDNFSRDEIRRKVERFIKLLREESAGKIDYIIVPEKHDSEKTNESKRGSHHCQTAPNPFTPQEIKLILENAESQTQNLFKFAFFSGLRTSELIALEWGDVDFLRGTVKVSRASVRKIVKETKTQSGEREVKLLSPALEALNAQLPFTFEARGRIFHNPKTNSPWITDGQIRKSAWMPVLKAAGVPYRNPYQTRHTYASMLLSAGEDPMWVSHQMGHSDWGMIRKVYGRWIPDMNPVAGGKLEDLWSRLGQSADKGL